MHRLFLPFVTFVPFRPILLFLALAPALAGAQPTHAKLDQYLRARTALGAFNGTVLVARGDTLLHLRGYGSADVRHRVPATGATRYAVASISKMFTAGAVLRLAERGALRLEDPVCRHVAECPAAWQAVTIDQLLHHTSGIPDYEAPLELGSSRYLDFMLPARSAERILAEARTKPLDFTPGTKFRYSNTAYILAAAIVERVAGRPFADVVRAELLAPAGMRTAAVIHRDSVFPGLAAGYQRTVTALPALIAGITLDERALAPVPLVPLDGPHGDGNLVLAATDLLAWTRALARGTVLSAASRERMLTPGEGTYGLGWFVGTRFGRRALSHSGAIPGYSSFVEWYPDSRTTIVVLSNVVGTRMSRVVRDVAAITLGQPYDVPVARRVVPFDSAAALPLAGEYRLADGAVATVTLDPTMLAVQIPDRFTAGALPVGGDTYYAPFFENTVRFERDANGRGRRILLRINGETVVGVRR